MFLYASIHGQAFSTKQHIAAFALPDSTSLGVDLRLYHLLWYFQC